MYYKNDSDFDATAWNARLEEARTGDEFIALLKELPTEKPMNDDEAISRFKSEPTWSGIDDAESMLGWCRFWFAAEWCLPFDQQGRCTGRLMREAGYPLDIEIAESASNKNFLRWHAAIRECVLEQ